MPKEQINTPATRVITLIDDGKPGSYAMGWPEMGHELHPGETFEHTPILWLGWSRGPEGLDDEDLVFYVDIAEDEILRTAEMIKYNRSLPIGVIKHDVEPMWTFSSVVLKRKEMLNLIRTARRAMHAVFGADE